jgi:hypothetical protein
MREQMRKLQIYTIDIAKDPATAIKMISDPILELLNLKIEGFEEELKENMAKKKELTGDKAHFKNDIFE